MNRINKKIFKILKLIKIYNKIKIINNNNLIQITYRTKFNICSVQITSIEIKNRKFKI